MGGWCEGEREWPRWGSDFCCSGSSNSDDAGVMSDGEHQALRGAAVKSFLLKYFQANNIISL